MEQLFSDVGIVPSHPLPGGLESVLVKLDSIADHLVLLLEAFLQSQLSLKANASVPDVEHVHAGGEPVVENVHVVGDPVVDFACDIHAGGEHVVEHVHAVGDPVGDFARVDVLLEVAPLPCVQGHAW